MWLIFKLIVLCLDFFIGVLIVLYNVIVIYLFFFFLSYGVLCIIVKWSFIVWRMFVNWIWFFVILYKVFIIVW